MEELTGTDVRSTVRRKSTSRTIGRLGALAASGHGVSNISTLVPVIRFSVGVALNHADPSQSVETEVSFMQVADSCCIPWSSMNAAF